MKKSIKVTAVAAAMTIAMAATAFAAPFAFTGTWQGGTGANVNRWWYAKDAAKTTWYAGTTTMPYWVWIDGNKDGVAECYAFDAQGWMYQNTTTPDNYTVNVNGAWTVNGYVQTQASTNFTMVSNSSSSSSSGGSGSSTTSATAKAEAIASTITAKTTTIEKAVASTGLQKVVVNEPETSNGEVYVLVTADTTNTTTANTAVTAVEKAVSASGVDTATVTGVQIEGDSTVYKTYAAAKQAAEEKAKAATAAGVDMSGKSKTVTVSYSNGTTATIELSLN